MEGNTFAQGDRVNSTLEPEHGNTQDGSRALYTQVDSQRQATSDPGAASTRDGSGRSFYGIIPPYMLENMAEQDKDNTNGFANTYDRTLEMQEQMLFKPSFRPRATPDSQGVREVYDAKGLEEMPGQKARFEGEPETGDKDVDAAYDLTGIVRDFYQKEFSRNSIDGKGMKVASTVNYGYNYQNAFWSGSQITFGRPGMLSPYKTFLVLDIAAHEITHGVTENESDFLYWGQSGALNESMSDVFGELIQQYSLNQTADQADWVVGDQMMNKSVNGRGLRDMLNPGTAYDDRRLGGKDPQPGHMKDYKRVNTDNCGVHINSGIPNRAFALFARSVGGQAWKDPGHIWFEARKHAGKRPSFASFAYDTIEAARKLSTEDVVKKLEQAWADVGVTPQKGAQDRLSPEPEEVEEEKAKKTKRSG